MNPIKFILIIQLILVHSAYCNMWDNIFSNLESPNVSLPKEFKVELFSSGNYSYKAAEILASSSLNRLKITIYDTLKLTNSLSLLIKLLLNTPEQKEPEVMFTLEVDFGNSLITTHSYGECQYNKLTGLGNINIGLLLASYDLFTYYESQESFDKYVVTNPRTNIKDEKFAKFLPIFNTLGTVDKNALLVFEVDKSSRYLQGIDIKFNDIEYFYFKTRVSLLELNDWDFSKIDLSQCVLIDINKSLLQMLLDGLS